MNATLFTGRLNTWWRIHTWHASVCPAESEMILRLTQNLESKGEWNCRSCSQVTAAEWCRTLRHLTAAADEELACACVCVGGVMEIFSCAAVGLLGFGVDVAHLWTLMYKDSRTWKKAHSCQSWAAANQNWIWKSDLKIFTSLRLADVLVDDIAGVGLMFLLLPHEQHTLMDEHVLLLRTHRMIVRFCWWDVRESGMLCTSVWTIESLCERISDTRPRISTYSCSWMCCMRRSRAMNVPVRPTPALTHKHTKHHNLTHIHETCTSAFIILEFEWTFKAFYLQVDLKPSPSLQCCIIWTQAGNQY